MTSEKVIFDTNLYIYHYLGYSTIKSLFNEIIDQNKKILMPAIVVMELMAYHKVENNKEIKEAMQSYIDEADEIIDITKEIALKAAEIRRRWYLESGKKLKHGDSLIAAASLVTNAVLYSNNNNDFKYIEAEFGLKYKNPVDNLHLNEFMKSLKY